MKHVICNEKIDNALGTLAVFIQDMIDGNSSDSEEDVQIIRNSIFELFMEIFMEMDIEKTMIDESIPLAHEHFCVLVKQFLKLEIQQEGIIKKIICKADRTLYLDDMYTGPSL